MVIKNITNNLDCTYSELKNSAVENLMNVFDKKIFRS